MQLRKINSSILLFAGLLISIAATQGASLQADLVKQYPITQVASDGSVINAGAVLILQKDGFFTYGISTPLPALNTWKNGKFSIGFGRAFTVTANMNKQGQTNLPSRKFVTGETFWIIGIAVDKDALTFRLLSDPINGFRYFGDLKFPFPKNSPPSLEDAVQQISEAVTIQQQAKAGATEDSTAAAASPQTPAAPAAAADPAMAPIPPPPPPIESHTVNLGDTPDQVTAALGQPKNIFNIGVKQIYTYANLKITFENGKVIDVQ
jgi:hypothetical protein